MGYRLEDGRLQLGDESEIAIVRRIFAMRSQGYGAFTISKVLNNENIRTGTGARWHACSVRHVLKA